MDFFIASQALFTPECRK